MSVTNLKKLRLTTARQSSIGVQAGIAARAQAQRCYGAAASGRRLLGDRAVARS